MKQCYSTSLQPLTGRTHNQWAATTSDSPLPNLRRPPPHSLRRTPPPHHRPPHRVAGPMWERGRPPRKPRPSPILVPPPPSPPPPRLNLLLPRSLLSLAASAMPSRRPSPVLLLLLALSLALLFLLLSPSSPSASRFSRSLSSGSAIASSSPPSTSSLPAPVKIYLYDLPAKFTYGIVRSYMAARAPSGSADAAAALPDEQLRYPGHQHSAEWWLFKDLLRRRPRDRLVARVDDPSDADLFYVPFFSSLSLVVNPIRSPLAANASGAAAAYSDEAMQEELLEWLERQPYWRRHMGRDHVFICQDPNALYKVIDRISNAVLLVSDFGRLRSDQASLVKDVILPYSHRINSFKGEVGVDGRPSLLFFMGNRYRKEVTLEFWKKHDEFNLIGALVSLLSTTAFLRGAYML